VSVNCKFVTALLFIEQERILKEEQKALCRGHRIPLKKFRWETSVQNPTNRDTARLLGHNKCLHVATTTVYTAIDLVLDLDSARIQLDTLGHTPTPSVSVKSCHLCFLPGEPHHSYRSLLTTLLQFASSCILPIQRLLWYALVIHSHRMLQQQSYSEIDYYEEIVSVAYFCP